MPKTPFSRALVILKVPKYYIFNLDQKWGTKRYIDDMLVGFKASKDVHESQSSRIVDSMRQFGFKVDIKLFHDLNSIITDYDFVLTLGGDGTFLRAANFIYDNTPIMAINTDPSRSFCNFASFTSTIHDVEIKSVWEKLVKGNFDIVKRTRLEIVFNNDSLSDDESKNNTIEKHLALNELLFAEASIARASNFRLSVNGNKPVPYRSSGLIISTGSGSTGLLKSAMTIDPEVIQEIILETEKRKINDEEAQRLSQILISKHLMSGSSRDLFYFVREPIIQKEEDKKKPFRGNSKELLVQSAMDRSIVAIDGRELKQLQFGEKFTVKPAMQDLNCINLSF